MPPPSGSHRRAGRPLDGGVAVGDLAGVKDQALFVTMEGLAHDDTLVNLANHSYFNLEDDGDYAVKHDGESNFIVHGESPEDNGETSQLAFNEIGAIDGGLEVEDGEYIITVDADDGSWTPFR